VGGAQSGQVIIWLGFGGLIRGKFPRRTFEKKSGAIFFYGLKSTTKAQRKFFSTKVTGEK
jgi:hypothetical protein